MPTKAELGNKIVGFSDVQIAIWHSMIGQKVWKNPKTTTPSQPKPFKSGLKVNTVKGVAIHEHTPHLAFTFEEDNSQVECFRCSLAPEEFIPIHRTSVEFDSLTEKILGRYE